MKMNNEEIREKVVAALCKSLALGPHQVSDHSKLIEDLGMDSLDFLDITFTLEKEFGIKIRDADFDRVLRPDRSEAGAAGEFLSEEEIKALLPVLPALRQQGAQIPRRTLFSFITVETLIGMIGRKLNQP